MRTRPLYELRGLVLPWQTAISAFFQLSRDALIRKNRMISGIFHSFAAQTNGPARPPPQ
jgi:hypothetical protein